MNKYYIVGKKPVNNFKQTLKIMRITLFLLFFGILFSQAATGYSQGIRLTLNLKSASIKEICEEIEKQSDFRFIFAGNAKKIINKKVDLTANSQDIDEILDNILLNTELTYRILDKQIVVYFDEAKTSLKEVENIVYKSAQPQKKQITGTVTDISGVPIPGVNVIIKNTTTGSITNIDGKYSINVPDKNSVLVFSFMGYLSQEIQVGEQVYINVVLSEDTKMIDEVVVMAYGTIQRKNLIGAVEQIGSKTVETRAVGNVAQALQGAASNLIIQQRSANPNDNQLNINIRGISTIGDNAPLIVIDGIISSDLNTLNPMDIDKVSVLKDAGSTAIYGSRSANGVILITTKQGRLNEKLSIQFHGTYGFNAPEYTFKPVHGYENAILRNIADYNAGNSLSYTPEQIQYYKEMGDSEWFLKQILQNAPQQNYNLSVTGGSDKTTYMMSFGYFNQKSNFIGPNYGVERYNVRNHISTEIKRVKLSSNISYARTEGIDIGTNPENTIADAYRIPLYPDLTMKSDNGKYMLNNFLSEFNSLGMLEKGGRALSSQNYMMGNFEAEVKIMKGLALKGSIGTTIKTYHRFIRRTQVDFYLNASLDKPSNTVNTDNRVEDYNENNLGFHTQLLLDFNRTFNDVHRVYGLLGYSTESYTKKANEIHKEYTDPELGTPTSETIVSLTGSYNTPNNTEQNAIHSYFGRAGYSYLERYYAEMNFRYDGSSKFAKGRRWGFFPSFSGGWRASDESFMEFYKENVGDLKFRTSYGILGNQSVGNYQYVTTYKMTNAQYAFGNFPVSATSYSLSNPDLTWEKAKNFDVGMDMLFFNNKLGVSLGYFNKLTSDILLSPIISSTFGAGLANMNLGEVRNRGREATVNFYTTTGELNHHMSANIGDSKNKVIKYGNTKINKAEEFYLIIQEGLSYNSFYGYERDGYFQTEEEMAKGPHIEGQNISQLGLGDVRYKDLDGDGVITEKDRKVLGNAFPRYTFGFNYDLTWRGFDLSFFLQGVGKRTLAIRGELVDYYHFNWSNTMFEHQLDYWTPTNRNARYPRLAAPGSASNTNNYRQSSDIYLFNGAYLRMKNITLGYTIPSNLLSRVGIDRVRFYLTAENLFTISGVNFVDPEYTSLNSNMSGGAGSGRAYLTPRYFGCGIDLKF